MINSHCNTCEKQAIELEARNEEYHKRLLAYHEYLLSFNKKSEWELHEENTSTARHMYWLTDTCTIILISFATIIILFWKEIGIVAITGQLILITIGLAITINASLSARKWIKEYKTKERERLMKKDW